ncbi:hypothetical protein [Streptosporangium sandarakinum]
MIVRTGFMGQVAPGRKNRLFLEISDAGAGLAFDEEQPEPL